MNDASKPRTGGEILVDALRLHGVDTVFCVPGESYLAALDALYGARNRIRVVTCRQEGGAAYMAEAFGKATGKPGVCFVTRGPGACNAAIGVHTAMQDSTPMILFVGQVARDAFGREGFQEIDYRQMFQPPIAKLALQIDDAKRIPELVHHAFRTACSGRRGPVVVALPEDMLRDTATVADGQPYEAVQPHPGPEAMAALRKRMAAAERPLMMLGGSGWSAAACADARAFAEANGLPVCVSFRRQDLFDNTHPHYVGDLSTSVDPKLVARVRAADLLLVVGARLGEMTTRGYAMLDLPAPRQELVHVYPEAEEIGRVFQPALSIASGAAAFMKAARALDGVNGGRWAGWLADARADHMAYLTPRRFEGAVDMAAIVAAVQEAMPDAIVTVDAGNFSGWPQRFWRFRRYPSELGPTDGAMGYGIPAGIAAKIACPDRDVVTFVGDGGYMMTGQEIATAVHHGAAAIVVVVNNGAFGTIRMHQERDYPGRPIATALTNPDFAAVARACGAHGETVTATAEFAPALARARASGKCAVIEVRLDLEVITTRATLSEVRAAAVRDRSA